MCWIENGNSKVLKTFYMHKNVKGILERQWSRNKLCDEVKLKGIHIS